jgi:hypothetical protein
MPNMRINLNADLGEGYGPWTMGDDAAMLGVVSSANIACGGHAGDPDVMRTTLALARERGVSVGAHPSYPDLRGFGRRPMALSTQELENQLAAQIGALSAIAALESVRVTHVKPHGALNNQACVDRALADTICRAMRAIDPESDPAGAGRLGPGCGRSCRRADRGRGDLRRSRLPARRPTGAALPPRRHDPRRRSLPRPRHGHARGRRPDRHRWHTDFHADRQHLRAR